MMKTQADKTKETKSNAIANNTVVQQNTGHKILQPGDNRPATIAQRKIQEAANNSSQVKQLRTVQDMANESQRSKSATKVAQLEDIEMEEIRPRIVTCVAQGVQFQFGHSYSSVEINASQLQETDRVIYEIAWDAAVAPVGHEGMHVVANQASDFVVDKSQEGVAIGDVRSRYRRDGVNGFVFHFRDGIDWNTELNGGSWRFRVRVVNGAGTQVAISPVATVNWAH
jgi:hypothetical protein